MIEDGTVVFVKSRAEVRCPACRWNTSRAPRADQEYGQCPRCDAVLQPVQPREHLQRAVPVRPVPRESKFDTWFAEKYGSGHTWPELVAAELQRLEDVESD